MSRKGQSITLSVLENDKEKLNEIAREYGYMWGDRPNISKLIEAIARNQLLIAKNHDWALSRLEALEQARNTLIDAGKIEAAIEVSELLLSRSELPIPMRREIQKFVDQPPQPWRLEIEKYIKRQQPFQLGYQDAAGNLWQFTVRYAEIVAHEERKYLDCWCEETIGNKDIKELKNNWSLRLDRITDAAIMPIQGKWEQKLAQIPVEIHLLNGLAFAYKPKPEDELIEWVSPQVKKVVKNISSTYWFTRQVMKNAPDMVIISPPSVYNIFQEKLIATLKNYKLN